MVTVTINGMSVPAERVSEGWVNQMIAESHRRHTALCLQVSIDDPSAQILFSTPGCGGAGRGTNTWNDKERRIIEGWNRRGLGGAVISPGDLRAFLNDVSRLL